MEASWKVRTPSNMYARTDACISSGLRTAQALGMHRDPGWVKWEAMHKVERELRVTGWWLLVVSDRFAQPSDGLIGY